MNLSSDTIIDPSVHIIILNWNGYKNTFECLNSLNQIKYKNCDIVLIDNGSETDEIDNILTYFSNIKIIKTENNLGFTGGNNLGIKYSMENNADFILLLNNDTVVEPDFLEFLLNKFMSHPKTGVVAPKISYYNKPEKIWSVGGKINIIRGSGVSYTNERSLKKANGEMGFVSGCCMLIGRNVFENVGLFDEKYFLYDEDADLCCRTINAGYKIYTETKSRIYHKIKASTAKNFSNLSLYYETRNRLYFAKKNFKSFYLFTTVYICFTMLLKSLFWICTGKSGRVSAALKGIKDFFYNRMGKISHQLPKI